MKPAILTEALWFPDPRAAPRGLHTSLVAVGGDLRVERLLLAYRSGIFPWTARPLTWWSPDPRAIFELDRFHIPRRLAASRRRTPFRVTTDAAFRAVIEGCAAQPRPGGWIGPEFVEAYTRLHEAGHAHSVECWAGDRLAGGIYGVSVGGLFAGESMFHRDTGASKLALCHLVEHLRARAYALFDLQMLTPLTASFGAVLISRDDYLRRLAQAVDRPCRF